MLEDSLEEDNLLDTRKERPRNEIEPPETEIAMAHDFTQPKSKILDPEQFPYQAKMIEPITQDIATSHLSEQASGVVHDNYRLILNIIALAQLTGRDLIEVERFHAGKISTYANVSKGELGNMIKILRSNWNITETKSEERIEANQRIIEQTPKRQIFDFGGGQGGR